MSNIKQTLETCLFRAPLLNRPKSTLFLACTLCLSFLIHHINHDSQIVRQFTYALVLLPALFLIPLTSYREFIRNRQAQITLGLIWGCFLSSLIFNGDYENIKPTVYLTIFTLLVWYLRCVQGFNPKPLVTLMLGLALIMGIAAAIDFYWVTEASLNRRLWGIHSNYYSNPILASGFLLSALLMYIALQNEIKANHLIFFTATLGLMVAYQSRSTFVMLFAVMGAAAFLNFRVLLSQRKVIFTSAAVLIALLLIAFESGFVEQLINRGSSHRLGAWQALINSTLECGWLSGCGYDFQQVTATTATVNHAHNIFLAAFVAGGVIDLVLVTFFFFYILAYSLKTNSPFIWAFIASWVYMLFDGTQLIDSPNEIWTLFWLPTLLILFPQKQDT